MSQKGYNEVIEIEALNELITWNNPLLISILLLLIEELNNSPHIVDKYSFSVIPYGFLGSYPAIGVQYAYKDLPKIEDFVVDEYKKLSQKLNIETLIAYIGAKNEIINELNKEIISSNKDHRW